MPAYSPPMGGKAGVQPIGGEGGCGFPALLCFPPGPPQASMQDLASEAGETFFLLLQVATSQPCHYGEAPSRPPRSSGGSGSSAEVPPTAAGQAEGCLAMAWLAQGSQRGLH